MRAAKSQNLFAECPGFLIPCLPPPVKRLGKKIGRSMGEGGPGARKRLLVGSQLLAGRPLPPEGEVGYQGKIIRYRRVSPLPYCAYSSIASAVLKTTRFGA